MPYKSRTQQRRSQREYLARRRAKHVADFGGRCALCGDDRDLQFDHIDPDTKAISISQIWSRRQEVVDAELAKCQLLCLPCHKKKTFEDRGYGQHGVQRYKEGCRCRVCRDIQAARMRRWRAQKRQ